MAIPASISLRFVTPERQLVHEDVDELVLPGEEGSFGVLPGHAPLLAVLRPGEMWFRKGNVTQYAFLDGGFAEVLPESVSILAQVAERAEDIDLARAEAAKRRAEEKLARAASIDIDVERERLAILRATMRLDLAARRRSRG